MKKLREIERIGSISGKTFNYDKFIDRESATADKLNKERTQVKNFDIQWSESPKVVRVIAYENNIPAGYVALKKFMDGYKIYTLGVKPDFRRKGVAAVLYDYIIGRVKLYSDSMQTPESRKLWINLSKKYNVKGLNKETGNIFDVAPEGDELKSLDPQEIMYKDGKSDTVLFIVKESRSIFDNWRRFLNEQHTKNMSYSSDLQNAVAQYEAGGAPFKELPYQDSGKVWTIGFGTTKYPDGTPVGPKDPKITRGKAEEYLTFGLADAAKYVNNYVKQDLTQNQFDALVSLVHNIGSGAFGKSSILQLINNNPTDPKIAKEFMLYVKDRKGVVQPGLKNRRSFESNLYFEGTPSDDVSGQTKAPPLKRVKKDRISLDPSDREYNFS